TAGLNRGANQRPFFDGLLLDDSAAGTWLPVVMKDGKDVLFTSEAERAAFVPQIEVSHLMYNAVWGPKGKPDWASSGFFENNRSNPRILLHKPPTPNHHIYHITNTPTTRHQCCETLPDVRRV